LIEAQTFTNVSVKLEMDSESILRLQRKQPRYSNKRIERVLPLYYFDDFDEECTQIKAQIDKRLRAELPPLQVQVTMKEMQNGKMTRVVKDGKCIDFLQDTK